MNIPARRILTIALLSLAASSSSANQESQADSFEIELAGLVTPAEQAFLMAELERIQPPERIHELAAYGERQSELGGGFYGLMPDQLSDPASIPVPVDRPGRVAAALCLARQRAVNLAELARIQPDFAVEFRDESLGDFLSTLEPSDAAKPVPAIELKLELDTSAIRGFVAALADGEISVAEADSLAALASNQAMLEHRRNLGYVPEPLPDTADLAELIRMAGSRDPLDHLWCWVNSQNAFGYADVSQRPEGYRSLIAQLDAHEADLTRAALERITRFTPAGTRFETTFAFTVGWAIRGWATPDMAGLNIEQVKDDWYYLYGTLVEESYHRLQLELIPVKTDSPATELSNLVAIETGDERLDRLYEIVTYTVTEGAANLVRGPFADPELAGKAPAGAELVARFVREVVDDGDLESADAIINEGLKSNGPLYGLGWQLASRIAAAEGERAVGEWQRRGAVPFFLHAAELASEDQPALLDPGVITAVRRLEAFDSKAANR